MKDYVIQATGFKSPAEMYAEPGIDWNTLLLPKPHAMYSMRVEGQGGLSFGIFNQDLLIIDTSRTPNQGELLVVALENEFLLGKIEHKSQNNGRVFLTGNEEIPLSVDQELRVVGVVARLIRLYQEE